MIKFRTAYDGACYYNVEERQQEERRREKHRKRWKEDKNRKIVTNTSVPGVAVVRALALREIALEEEKERRAEAIKRAGKK